MLRQTLLSLATLALLANLSRGADGPVDADIVLSGGTIMDGAGGPPRVGDVAIRGQRIVAVGNFPRGKVGQTIECQGLVVAPGFIDLHNHSDFPILRDATRPAVNYLTQGCTTIVTGNCGGGQLDVGKYLKQLDKLGAGVNVVHLIPAGALRKKVLGSVKQSPTGDELKDMRRLAEQGMKDGAFGMSTGLIYVPGAYADTDEIVALAEVVASHGGIYASHIRGEGSTLLDAVQEALEIGRRSGAPVHISHFKCMGRPYWGSVRAAAKLIEQARAKGQKATADQYPYIASSTSLSAMMLPSADREGGKKAVQQRLKDPRQAPRLREAMARSLKLRNRIQVASYKPKPAWAGRMLSDIAKEEGREVVDVAFEIIASGDAGAVNFGMSEEDVRYVMTLPWVATASDGGVKVASEARPHPRSFGTFTRKLGHYAVAEKNISLPHAVRSSSGLPADILGMKDRGYIRPNGYADVVVFDPLTVRDRATFASPFEHSQGVRWVFVNGAAAIADGKPTGKLAGLALRHKE